MSPSLSRKLGIAPGHRVLVAGRPDEFDTSQLDPQRQARVHTRPGPAPYDVVLAFCPDAASLRRRLPALLPRLAPGGRLWICWLKQASGRVTDLGEQGVRDGGLAAGVVDVKICAVDATWSGLCFMRRRRDRPTTDAGA